jgi:membrane associated rhomboid family serine protease
MLIPIRDDNPVRLIRFQVMTAIIIALNVIMFALTGGVGGEQSIAAVATGFGVIPVELFNGASAYVSDFNPIAEPLTLITYQFLHGSWMHLASNMLIMWILADNIEDAFGHVGFVVFYLACGVLAALTHAFLAPGSPVPLVGASGAIAGVMGAYLLLYPKARITMLLGFVFPFRIPAWGFLGFWIVSQFISLSVVQKEGVAVAYAAHIGGFVAGMLLTLVWPTRRKTH